MFPPLMGRIKHIICIPMKSVNERNRPDPLANRPVLWYNDWYKRKPGSCAGLSIDSIVRGGKESCRPKVTVQVRTVPVHPALSPVLEAHLVLFPEHPLGQARILTAATLPPRQSHPAGLLALPHPAGRVPIPGPAIPALLRKPEWLHSRGTVPGPGSISRSVLLYQLAGDRFIITPGGTTMCIIRSHGQTAAPVCIMSAAIMMKSAAVTTVLLSRKTGDTKMFAATVHTVSRIPSSQWKAIHRCRKSLPAHTAAV